MKFELEPYHRNVSDDELLSDLRRVALKRGKNSVTRFEQDELGKFHSTTFVKRFGKWSQALDKACLGQAGTPKNLTEEELFKNLEEVWTRLGRQPRYQEVRKPLSKYNVKPYETRFGTWRKALEAFVIFINNEERTPSELADAPHLDPKLTLKGSRNINWRLRFIVMRRDNFKCKVCGRTPANDPTIVLHLDHILAWAKGGRTVLENLQTLCSVCNIGKSDLDLEVSEVTNVATI